MPSLKEIMEEQKKEKGLKEIMEEQKREKEALEVKVAVQMKRDFEKEKIFKERISCASVLKMLIVKDKEGIEEFMKKGRFWYKFELDRLSGVVHSLHVPESRSQTHRYIKERLKGLNYEDYENEEKMDEQFRKMLDFATLPFFYLKLNYIYGDHYVIVWHEEGLWKALHFYFCRCPSGGCDSEHIDLLVAVSPDDLLDMIGFIKIYPSDRVEIIEEMMKIVSH